MPATLILSLVASGCGQRHVSSGVAPRLATISGVPKVNTTLSPVTTVHVSSIDATRGTNATIPWRHSYAGATTPLPPMLMLIDGVPLGLRPDSSVDHDAAKVLLQQIRCRDVVSISVLKGDEALRRFGRAANPGTILITTASHTWRARAGYP